MDGPRSRSFALAFAAVLVLGTVALILFAERSLRSREAWTLAIEAEPTAAGWSLRAEPSRDVHLYVLVDVGESELRLVFPGPQDGQARPLPGGSPFVREVSAEAGAELLVLADPLPLWKLEERRARDREATAEGFVRLDPAVLAEVRGLPAGGARALAPSPPSRRSEEPTTVRGLYARRFAAS